MIVSDAHSVRTTALPSMHGSPELAVRPKVMRRPVQLARMPMVERESAPSLARVSSPEPPATATPLRPWQDDGAFAMALLAVVILVNLLLSTWLAALPVAPKVTVLSAPAPVVHILDETADTESDQ